MLLMFRFWATLSLPSLLKYQRVVGISARAGSGRNDSAESLPTLYLFRTQIIRIADAKETRPLL